MPLFSQENPSNNSPANELASQSIQQPQLVCSWSARVPQSGSSSSPFPRGGRRGYGLTETANASGELFLFGGRTAHDCENNDVYVISTRDFSTTLLQTSGGAPTPRSGHGAALIGTILLICGGKTNPTVTRTSSALNHDQLYLLNLGTNAEWSRVLVSGPGPSSRCYYTTNVVGSKLFIFGGQIGSSQIMNDMWTLDLNCLNSHPVWESYEPIPRNEKPLPRCAHVSVTTGDHIIIFGGMGHAKGNPHSVMHFYNDTWCFEISTRKWTELKCTGSIPSPRSGHTAVLVDDVMYVFGGHTGRAFLDDLIALQLSTQRWFKFHNVGPGPRRRGSFESRNIASDGTHVFVLGGFSADSQVDDIPFIHVFDTKHIKYPEADGNAVNPNEKTTQLLWKLSTGPSTQERPQHPTSSSSDARGASRLQKASPAESGLPASLKITHEQNPGRNVRPLEHAVVRDPEDGVGEGSTECRGELSGPHSSSEGEVTRLELERQLSVSLSVQTERGHRIAQLTDELALKSALLEQAEANAADGKRRARLELVDTQTKLKTTEATLDELLLSFDQQIGRREVEVANVRAKLEAKESEMEALRLRLADAAKGLTSLDVLAVSRRRQVEQHEKELTNVRTKLEAKEWELEAVRSRLTGAEKELTKSKAEKSRCTQDATGSVNRGEDQVTRRLMERVRAFEAQMGSKRWNEKSREEMEYSNEEDIEEMECSNDKNIEEMECGNEKNIEEMECSNEKNIEETDYHNEG